eukprot:817014-Prorocentrum_minimum.AAC.1
MCDTLLCNVKHKVFILDRSKGATAQPYVLIKPGHNVFVRAHAARTHMEKLRIVNREFIVCEQFLSNTTHQPIASRGSGVFKLPHLVYEEWIEDKDVNKHPQQYIVVNLKPGTVIPTSTLEQLVGSLALNFC